MNGVSLADSISDYYWVPDGPDAPSRDLFVGCLFAVAAILYLYKGFSKAENIALNLAALLAVGVALFPTAENDLASGGTWGGRQQSSGGQDRRWGIAPSQERCTVQTEAGFPKKPGSP